eukprot:jgi/Ulvmu1/381/UM001_0388.1
MPLASQESRVSIAGGLGGKVSRTKLLWHQFSRQYTPGHRTVFSLKFAIGTFIGLCLMFLIGGSIMLSQSLSLVQIRIVYSDSAPMSSYSVDERSMLLQGQAVGNLSQAVQPIVSEIRVPVEKDMDAPINIYYVLHKFYQSHKRYVRSVHYGQLHGNNASTSSLEVCKPQRYITNQANNTFEQQGLITPCGLAAWSLFNDTFSDFRVVRSDSNGTEEAIQVDSTDLAWDSDRETFFGDVDPANHNTEPALRGGRAMELQLNRDELFMTWMRVSAHPNVRKFYGTIDEDLKEGDELRLSVTHLFNTYGFDGQKDLLLTTAGAFGNRNPTFGIAWITMGILSLAIACTYTILGWRQVWDPLERIDGLQSRWRRGSRLRAGSAVPTFCAVQQDIKSGV